MITITKESAMLLLDQLYKADMIGKYSTGEYVIASETGCFGMTPEEAAEDLAPKLVEIDLLMETASLGVRSSALRDITLPDLMVSDPLANSKHVITFDSETAHGEPQAWVYLKDGSSIEITHEEYGLEPNEQYFSLRHHCSEEDFENDVYHSTMGVIDECSGGLAAIAPMLQRITDAIGISDEPHDDSKTIVLSSKTLAGYEDEFEDKLFHAAHDLLHDCTQGHGIPDYDAFAQACLDSDLHNYVKTGFYDLFRALGFDIRSDGTDF